MLDVSSVRNEIRAITKLCDGNHINIIKVLRCGEYQDSSYAYIDMELCSLNLEEYLKSKWILYPVDGVPDEAGIWNIMTQIANGLAFIHSKKEIHRDLKPSNSIKPISVSGIDWGSFIQRWG
jgi:serine/threonine protein kinase